MEKDDKALCLLQGIEGTAVSSLHFFHRQSVLLTDGRNVSETNVSCYSYDKNDCTVREMYFKYKEYTPKKTEVEKKYDGSPMEIEYFDNTTTTIEPDTHSENILTKRKKKTVKRRIDCSEKEIYIDLKGNSNFLKAKITFTLILLLTLSYMFYYKGVRIIASDSCDCEVNVDLLQKALLENVYNQVDCIDLITESLQQKNEWPEKMKTLVLMGTMGVGKTFISNIVKMHFPKEAVHEVVHLKQQTDGNSCCNLIIMDNLNGFEVNDVIELLNSTNASRYTLVLAIFNVQKTDNNLNYSFDHDAVTTILSRFEASFLHFNSCIFNYISEREVQTWLEKEFAERQIQEELQKRIRNHIFANSNFKEKGFKGLSKKLSLVSETFTD